MSSTKWHRVAKIAAITALILGVALGAMVSCAVFLDWSAEKKADAFCDETAIGSDISTAIARAKNKGILQGPREGAYKGHAFYFSGFVFSKGVCEVSVGQYGKVTSKFSSMERD